MALQNSHIARAVLVFAALMLCGIWAHLNGGQAGTSRGSPTSPVTPESLPVGTECTVHIARGQVQESITGAIRKVTPEWVLLHSNRGIPVLNKVPYLSRHFKETGVQNQNRDLWIPRDAVLYVTFETASELDGSTARAGD